MMDFARTIALFACAFALLLGAVTLKRDPMPRTQPSNKRNNGNAGPVEVHFGNIRVVDVPTIVRSYTCGESTGPQFPESIARCQELRYRSALGGARLQITEWSNGVVDVRDDEGRLFRIEHMDVRVPVMPFIAGEADR